MPNLIVKRLSIVVLLGVFMAAASFLWFKDFTSATHAEYKTIDEVGYYLMARQVLKQGLSGYQMATFGKDLEKLGWTSLPEYFNKPVFKYPPLFTLLLAGSMKLFGPSLNSAYYVSLFFGVLLIPLIYILGARSFNRAVGMGAAFFLFIDPIHIMSSQKLWMDTTLSFLTVLSVLLFMIAVKEKKDVFFALSGLVCGLAVLTKYPGILPVGVFILYAVIYERQLFKSKFFISALILPFVMLIPWLIWNLDVYGLGFLGGQVGSFSDHGQVQHVQRYLFYMVWFVLAYALFRVWAKRDNVRLIPADEKHQVKIRILLAVVFLVLLRRPFAHGWQYHFVPVTSYAPELFAKASVLFYPGRLLEFSLIYMFACLMYVRPFAGRDTSEIRILKLSVLVILGFYTLWGNYQSRYILAAVPLLLVLAAKSCEILLVKAFMMENVKKSAFFTLALIGLIVFIIARTNHINMVLSFTNNYCYF